MIKQFLAYKYLCYFLIRILLFLIIITSVANISYSQNMPVPENIQAALIPKVLKFSPNISRKPKIRILIVYDNKSVNSKNDFINELAGSMDIKAILPEALENNISNCDLVYFMPGIQMKSSLCKTYKVLSITGISQYVESGQVSLALGLENNKPKIFINLSSLDKEGQSLSSEILRIATVYN